MAFHPPVHHEFVLALRIVDAFEMPYAEAWRLLQPVAARSAKTVAAHIDHILQKLGVHSSAQAVAVAYRDGHVTT